MRGKKEVASLTSAVLSLCECHWNIRFTINRVPEKNMKEELMGGAPAGSIAACHPSIWIQTDVFPKWFQHFFTMLSLRQMILYC
jgi:hypothetical protein